MDQKTLNKAGQNFQMFYKIEQLISASYFVQLVMIGPLFLMFRLHFVWRDNLFIVCQTTD